MSECVKDEWRAGTMDRGWLLAIRSTNRGWLLAGCQQCKLLMNRVPAKKTIDVSDTDSEFDVPKNKKKITKVLNTSDAMFDNLVGSGSGGSVDAPVEVSSDDDMFSNKKAAPKKRMLHKIDKEATVQIQKKTVPKRATKKRVYLDDSQDEEEDIMPKKSRGKKKVESSDEEFTIEDSDF
uniref:Uncharacterized protein n=1 Tax=Timema douglasi TaxID=61478 RepID=A0A7R8V8T6_TIMDO|nr:unnamed protein product [Timema douglasi]